MLNIALAAAAILAIALLVSGLIMGAVIACFTKYTSGHDHIDETRRIWRIMNWAGRVILWPWVAVHAVGYLLGFETIRTTRELWAAVFYKR